MPPQPHHAGELLVVTESSHSSYTSSVLFADYVFAEQRKDEDYDDVVEESLLNEVSCCFVILDNTAVLGKFGVFCGIFFVYELRALGTFQYVIFIVL